LHPQYPIRVAIIDDHHVFAEELAKALPTDQRLAIHGLFSNAQECIDALTAGAKVDLLLSGFSIPPMNGIELLAQVKQLRSEIVCVLLTRHDVADLHRRCRRAGIDGYLHRTSSMHEIREQLLRFASLDKVNNQDDMSNDFNVLYQIALSPSEIEIVRCVVCLELSSRATAEFLNRSHHTVEQHRKHIYAKLGIDSIAALTKYAISMGICSGIDPTNQVD
jgi:DNA-binding NarL/FixJ family response regulator